MARLVEGPVIDGCTMAYSADFPRTFVLRAKRETVLLVAGAIAMTFALSSVVHSHRVSVAANTSPAPQLQQQQWAGGLSDIATTHAAFEPLTSASLVVPSSDLALPQLPPVRALVKIHGCDGSLCSTKSAPTRRPTAVASTQGDPARRVAAPLNRHTKPSLMSRINPLNHLPDMSTISRPFATAGDAVSGWFRRF